MDKELSDIVRWDGMRGPRQSRQGGRVGVYAPVNLCYCLLARPGSITNSHPVVIPLCALCFLHSFFFSTLTELS